MVERQHFFWNRIEVDVTYSLPSVQLYSEPTDSGFSSQQSSIVVKVSKSTYLANQVP